MIILYKPFGNTNSCIVYNKHYEINNKPDRFNMNKRDHCLLLHAITPQFYINNKDFSSNGKYQFPFLSDKTMLVNIIKCLVCLFGLFPVVLARMPIHDMFHFGIKEYLPYYTAITKSFKTSNRIYYNPLHIAVL